MPLKECMEKIAMVARERRERLAALRQRDESVRALRTMCPVCGAAPGQLCADPQGLPIFARKQYGEPHLARIARLRRLDINALAAMCPVCGAAPGRACTEEGNDGSEKLTSPHPLRADSARLAQPGASS